MNKDNALLLAVATCTVILRFRINTLCCMNTEENKMNIYIYIYI
jgi:hypothetical protein